MDTDETICETCGRTLWPPPTAASYIWPGPLDEEMEPIARLSRDLREAAKLLTRDQARYLVDYYYAMQADRIRAAHQQRMHAQGAEPHAVIVWLQRQTETLESRVRSALDIYSANQPAGIWARSISGIGPVIAAGLLCHIDITRAPTVGHVWSFAGLNPERKWNKGQKRPWNAALKRLCWLIGESFVKVSNRPTDTYGAYYKMRKEWETDRNEKLAYKDQAEAALKDKKWDKDTDAYKAYIQGKLPPARIHLRAERFAVKLFLSHLHEVMHVIEYKKLPPKPWVLDHVAGHSHKVELPNPELVPGLLNLRR
jgi:transposase IS116/IS110/IS902 family protein